MRSRLVVERHISFFSDPLTGSWFLFVLGRGHRVSSHFLSSPLVKAPITSELKHLIPIPVFPLETQDRGSDETTSPWESLFQAVSGFSFTMNGCPCNSDISDLPISLSYRANWSSVGPKSLSDNYCLNFSRCYLVHSSG